jgi:hypothetical protein
MSLTQRLAEYVAAAFTGIWIQSFEHADAQSEIAALCRARGWAMAAWDLERGLQSDAQAAPESVDPVAAIRSINALASAEGSALLLLPNFHRFLQSSEILQALAHQVEAGKRNRTFIVILSPVVQIPVELEKQFIVLEHELPDRRQLEQIARSIADQPGEMPQAQDLERLLDAAAGLTRYEAEGAFSLSLVRESKLTPGAVWELKSGMLTKSGLLALHRGSESFADIGGLESIKSFCTRAINASRRSGAARARGVLVLGPPGSGKSLLCKALGNETGRPTIVLDVGALMGSLVGQTEQRVRQALRIVDAMSPAVLMIEEVEKALSGVASSGQTDSGVTARLFGTLLTWLSDHASDVFVVCSANDVSRLPPEFSRAQRFDGVFFLDLPGSAEKRRIWPIHLQRYGLDPALAEQRPDDRDWTGAEIESCCRLASLLDLPLTEAAKNVVPVAVTAAEQVQKLRAWASGRCLDACRGGIYRSSAAEPATATPGARRVSRASSN